jgi:predicted transcriptional regulator
MSFFDIPVSKYMRAPAQTLPDTARLEQAAERMDYMAISGLGIVDQRGGLVGVLSRTDLLRAGRPRSAERGLDRNLTLPNVSVRELMTTTVEVIAGTLPLHEAAARMLERRIHRLFIAEDHRPIGVLTSTDLVRAVADAKIASPIEHWMHSGVVSVKAHEPVSLAIDRMNNLERSGMVVVEEGWPVGIFTQAEALAARDAPSDERADTWMDARILCLPLAMPLHRAAEQAAATRSRRVLAVDASGVRGLLSPLDFVRAVRKA